MISLFELIMAVAILGALIFIIITLHARKHSQIDAVYYKGQWKKILATLNTGEQGWRLAIIDADRLLDQALKQTGARGESLADRLRDKEKTFARYNDVWAAHKLRNRLVHEPDVKLTKQVTSRALAAFHKALKELGAL